MEVDLSTKICGIEISNCCFNASGPRCTTLEELKAIGESRAGAISIKSATAEARKGNEKPRYFENEKISINSMGLPNPGYEKLAELVPEWKKFGKPVIASISGFSKQDYLKMLERFDIEGADVLELNLSCPNIQGKPQVGYDFEYSDELLKEARSLTKKPIAVKLPPYFDIIHQKEIAEVLKRNKVE